MSTRTFISTVGRLVVAAACLGSSVSCGSELLRTGRSPVYLTINQLDAAKGDSPDEFVSNLLSDVQTLVDVTVGGVTVKVPTIFNDFGRATIAVALKDPSIAATGINAVTITRYHVEFRRSDGRNAPGTDVPYAFDGGVTATIPVGGTGEVIFDLVRHAAKLEPPLRNLVGAGGRIFISTIAEITFYGRDQNGNEVIASGMMDVSFGDFGDEE
jgi:hypothetical protein